MYRHRFIPVALVFLVHALVLTYVCYGGVSESPPIPPVPEVVVQLLTATPAAMSRPVPPEPRREPVVKKTQTKVTHTRPLPVPAPSTVPTVAAQVPAHSSTSTVTPSTSAAASSAVNTSQVAAEPVYQEPVNAAYLNNPQPVYPSASRRAEETGKVVLRVYVDKEGAVAQIGVHKSSGFSRLDNAALETVKRWRFTPAKRGNEPVAGWVNVPITFKLDS